MDPVSRVRDFLLDNVGHMTHPGNPSFDAKSQRWLVPIYCRSERGSVVGRQRKGDTRGATAGCVCGHARAMQAEDALAVGHERRYGRRGLEQSLRAAGFDVETLRHVNPVGAVGWAVRMRLLRKREWPSTSFRMFDNLVPILRPLDALRLPFGLSLWAVARRSSRPTRD